MTPDAKPSSRSPEHAQWIEQSSANLLIDILDAEVNRCQKRARRSFFNDARVKLASRAATVGALARLYREEREKIRREAASAYSAGFESAREASAKAIEEAEVDFQVIAPSGRLGASQAKLLVFRAIEQCAKVIRALPIGTPGGRT